MLIFPLFSDQISGGTKVSEGAPPCGRKPGEPHYGLSGRGRPGSSLGLGGQFDQVAPAEEAGSTTWSSEGTKVGTRR